MPRNYTTSSLINETSSFPSTSTVDFHSFDRVFVGATTDDSSKYIRCVLCLIVIIFFEYTFFTVIGGRLIRDKEPALFVGESQTRSLPIALGIMRGSLDGVYASTYDKPAVPRAHSSEALIETQKERIEKNNDEMEKRSSE